MAAIQSSVITGGRLAATKLTAQVQCLLSPWRCDWTALLSSSDPWAGDSLDLVKVGPRPRGLLLEGLSVEALFLLGNWSGVACGQGMKSDIRVVTGCALPWLLLFKQRI